MLSHLDRSKVVHYPFGIVRPRVCPEMDHCNLPVEVDLSQCRAQSCTTKGILLAAKVYPKKEISNQFGLIELLALKEKGGDFFLDELLPFAVRYSKKIIGWRSVSWHDSQVHVPVLSFHVSSGPDVVWWSLDNLRLDCDCFEILLG